MRLFGYLLYISCSLMGIASVGAYNGHDLLTTLLDQDTQTISHNEIIPLVKGIRANSTDYRLVQQAIAQDIIQNSTRYINLHKEFTRDSVRKLVLVHMNIDLDIYGTEKIDPDTWSRIIETINYYQTQSRLTQQEQTQQELLKLLQEYGHTNLTGSNPTELIEGLDDEYADFFESTERELLDALLYGSFEGIGVTIEKGEQDAFLTIKQVFTNSPAAIAGLQKGDHIIRINDYIITSTDDIGSLSNRIKGPIGSMVNIRIQRGTEVFDRSIARARIAIPNITYTAHDTDTAIVKFHQFAVGSYDEFVRYIPRLRKAKTIILDLRDNGGGSLEDTNNILNHIIPKNDILYTINYGDYTVPIRSQGSYRTSALRPQQRIILVNEHTASASEVITSAIKSRRPNTLIAGTRTYGKGTIQTVIELHDNSILKLTSATRYVGKTTTSINKIGIAPDLLRPTSSYTEDTLLNHILGLLK